MSGFADRILEYFAILLQVQVPGTGTVSSPRILISGLRANPLYVYRRGIDVDFELREALRARMASALTGYISESFVVRGPCEQPALIDHGHREQCYGAKKTLVSSVFVTIGENGRSVGQICTPYRVKFN